MNQVMQDAAESIEAIKVFLPKMIDACYVAEKKFYEPINDSFWQQFAEIVEGMDDLYKTLQTVLSQIDNDRSYTALALRLQQAAAGISQSFQMLNVYVDEEDYVGASDILKYEFIPLFQQLAADLGEEDAVMQRRFEANQQFLKQQYPKAYEQLRTEAFGNQNHYQLTYSRNNKPNLAWIKENKKLKFIHSQYDPEDEANRWVRKITDKVMDKSDIIMYGFGLGYHAKAFSVAFSDKRLTIYEPDVQMLRSAMLMVDLQAIFSQLNMADFVVGPDKKTRNMLMHQFLKQMKGDPEIVALPLYDGMSETNLIQFSADAQMAILNYRGTVRMYEKFGWEWTENSLNNLAMTLGTSNIAGLKERFDGMKAVIAGAGPSLAEDIEALRQLKEHAFIIAAGTTIQSLLHYGIEPHLIVTMDGSEYNYNAFKGLDLRHIPLLYTPMVAYKIVDEKKDQLFHVHFTNDYVTKYLMDLKEDDPIVRPTNSVTGTAIQAAIYMGFKEIVFTGQDLSYPGKQLYAPGAEHLPKDYADAILKDVGLFVENVQGSMNPTNYGMKTTLADIEELLVNHPEIRFTNTSAQGAKIKHTTWMPMAEVLKQVQDTYMDSEILRRELGTLKSYDSERVVAAVARLTQLPEQLNQCYELLKQIDSHIDSVVEWSQINATKCVKAFMDIDKKWKLVVASSPFRVFFFLLFRNQLLQFERDLPELANETNTTRKAELARDIMQPLIQDMMAGTPRLSALFEESLRRVRANAQGE
ncbi:6-hydroxymethylpterin diphosphokinase MptE-like protein [Paenibacillus sp. NEAU-GSW1]|uniref:motility associated factor glycosyltransferase family protein n=1 Tax=Paenibacillus sp. NEAU-GSW1 TaxID=2682486 RepID=UPI0012E318B5|nr:6-hydroxymethylpterin diphosphokinase MptE-like protein [Paenibacillus sp. NEAU-GSW1]MUT65010.1 DUF115 domain-containing protein [Paenibacillus sp. NEAU-GSW1]